MAERKRYQKLIDMGADLIDKNDEFWPKVYKKSGKILSVTVDIGAALIDKNDEFWPKVYKLGEKGVSIIVDTGAAIVDKYDIFTLYAQRFTLKVRYHVAKFTHEKRVMIGKYRNQILTYSAEALLVAVAVVAVYNHFLCYEYSYNGRVMGYVSEQESVLVVLDMASEELSAEYGSDVKIESDSNITFKRVSAVQKTIDSEDDVLKRFTYMADVKTTGYAIYVNDVRYAILSSVGNASEVLMDIQDYYLSDSERTQYTYIGFKETIQIREEEADIVSISSVDQAFELLINGSRRAETYTVQSGDTYDEICDSFGITMDELKSMNPDLDESTPTEGDVLITKITTSALTVVTEETTQYTEVIEYETVWQEDDSMYEGDSRVAQEGENGKRIVTAKIVRENGEITEQEEVDSEIVQEAVTRIVRVGTKSVTATGSLILPVSGYSITYGYGYRWGSLHEGVDIPAPTGTSIRASDGGTVIRAGWYGAYGLCVDIDHGTGLVTRYAHCSSISVSVGQKVGQGQIIALVGNTGRSTGSHCHFETRLNGVAVNPMNYL